MKDFKRILVIGDLHGTYEALVAVARHFGCIDASLAWVAPDTLLVQTGDVCDRGKNSRDIYWLLIQWQTQAPRYNSKIVFILGNHEIMNMSGYFYYNNPFEVLGYAQKKYQLSVIEHHKAFKKKGWLYEWFLHQAAVFKAEDCIFAHADIPLVLCSSKVTDINRYVMEAVHNLSDSFEDFPAALFDQNDSILWCRQASKEADSNHVYEKAFYQFLKLNEARLYICGHTPYENGRIGQKMGNHYICIDTGMVFINQMDRLHASCLRIEDNHYWVHYWNDSMITEEELVLPSAVS